MKTRCTCGMYERSRALHQVFIEKYELFFFKSVSGEATYAVRLVNAHSLCTYICIVKKKTFFFWIFFQPQKIKNKRVSYFE